MARTVPCSMQHCSTLTMATAGKYTRKLVCRNVVLLTVGRIRNHTNSPAMAVYKSDSVCVASVSVSPPRAGLQQQTMQSYLGSQGNVGNWHARYNARYYAGCIYIHPFLCPAHLISWIVNTKSLTATQHENYFVDFFYNQMFRLKNIYAATESTVLFHLC